MSTPQNKPIRTPAYRGQAIVTLTDGCGNGRDVLLGLWRSKESGLE